MSDLILIVDDDKSIRYSLRRLLGIGDRSVIEASSGEEALEQLDKQSVSLILLDIQMRGISGLETLKEIKKRDLQIPVIILTAYGTTQTAIEAIKRGAYEYILKPFNPEELSRLVESTLDVSRMMRQEVRVSLIPESPQSKDGDLIIGTCSKMQDVYKTIGKIAESNVTVLLRGESGTGKELVARAIFQHSKRADHLFLPVNCAAIPDALLESELFGHEKGAFTGAQQTRIGKFEQCHGGTLFLDEIGDLQLSTQAKILRVLQEKEFQRVGSNNLIKSDVRLLAATHRNLEEMMREKQFREDLYYRLNVVSIYLPPLREREEDIPLLAEYFFQKYAKELGKSKNRISKEAIEKFKKYSWPGNVRELENCIQRSLVLARNQTLGADDFLFTPVAEGPAKLKDGVPSVQELSDQFFNLLKEASIQDNSEGLWDEVEKRLILLALDYTHGNQLRTAKLLGMNRNTIRKKITQYQIHIQTKVS